MTNSLQSPMMRHEEDGGMVFVQFKWESVRNDRMSEQHGRPVHDKVLRVYITAPGNKNQVAAHEVERHFWSPEGEEQKIRTNHIVANRFHKQLGAWKTDAAEQLSGTPLQELVALDVAQIATCKDMGIHTVEALANISDNDLFLGARQWRDLANAYLAKANDQQPLAELVAKNEEQATEIEFLKQQLAELKASIDNPKGKPGRPPKREAA